MYAFVRTDLPQPVQIVQTSHACIEAAKAFLDKDLEHPHLVVLSVKNEQSLYKISQKLDSSGIKYKVFIEPDRGDEATALCTEPVMGESRRIFRRYQLLKEKV